MEEFVIERSSVQIRPVALCSARPDKLISSPSRLWLLQLRCSYRLPRRFGSRFGRSGGMPREAAIELVGERPELVPASLANLRPLVTGAYWKATQML